MKVLMVLSSHDELGDTGKKTGFWLEEFAAPYYYFVDSGIDVAVASPLGGQPPVDPQSEDLPSHTDAKHRFKTDAAARAVLANTLKLADVAPTQFDAVFYPGGHGPLWDLAENTQSIALIEAMLATGKPVAAVCHGPGVLRHVKALDGGPMVSGRAVTGFTNTQEEADGLSDVVPFLVEDMLRASGALYSKGRDWQPYVISDGLLITGQNPASSERAAKCLLQKLKVLNAVDAKSLHHRQRDISCELR